jgi:hypothetical protein
LELVVGFKCMVLPLAEVLWILFCIVVGEKGNREAQECAAAAAQSPVGAAASEAEVMTEAAAMEGNKSSGLAQA